MRTTVRGAGNLPACFDNLPDEHHLGQTYPPTSTHHSNDNRLRVLAELPLDHQAPSCNRLNKSQDASCLQGTDSLAKVPSRSPRRRPPIGTETFEPLEETQENSPTCKKSVPSLAADHSVPRSPNSGSPSGSFGLPPWTRDLADFGLNRSRR